MSTEPIETELALRFHDAAWFAEQIGMSLDWVQHNVKRLPHHKVGRRTKFDLHCVAAYQDITARPGSPRLERSPGSQARKRPAR